MWKSSEFAIVLQLFVHLTYSFFTGQETTITITSFKIKEEDELYSMDHLDSERKGPTCTSKGNQSIRKKRKTRSSFEMTETPPCKVSSVKDDGKLIQQSQPSTMYRFPAENILEFGGVENIQGEIHLRKEPYSSLHQGSFQAEISHEYSACANKGCLNISAQDTPQNWKQFVGTEKKQLVSFMEDLAKHKKSVTKGRQYICSECGKAFTQMGNLLRHQTIHVGQKPYKCTECEKSFSQKVHFIRHQRTHSGERPYQCAECKKCFTRKETLLAHQKTHTGDRPYQCSECEKSYIVKQSLILHKRKHSGEKPYQCTLCDKRFRWKQTLVGHQRTHMTGQSKCTNSYRYSESQKKLKN